VIPALDTDDLAQACDWVELFKGRGPRIFKVGSQLFTRVGPKAVEEILDRGCGVFLDLKFHDIPNTAAQAARAAAALGVTMFNVHACGGKRMVRAAVEATLEEAAKKGLARPPLVLAVTVLTSLEEEDLRELGLCGEVRQWVTRWSQVALSAGVNGLVASAREVRELRRELGEKLVLVSPGIRAKGAAPRDDQRRVAGPGWALEQGADYLVMGRGLLEAEDPLGLLEEIEGPAQQGRG
jgi:orotidine-5'-phosphate decarboxylase